MSNYENHTTRRQIVKVLGGLTIVGAAVAGQAATADDKASNSSDNPANDGSSDNPANDGSSDNPADEIGPCVGTEHDDCPT